MRDIYTWRKRLVDSLKEQWPDEAPMTPIGMCNVELGLYLLSEVVPGESANMLWTLISGFPLEPRKLIGNGRHLLAAFKSRYQWQQALEDYRRLPDRVRGFEVKDDGHFARRPVTLAAHRYEVYGKALRSLLPYLTKTVRWGAKGKYIFFDAQKFRQQVIIDDEAFVLSPPPGHNLFRSKRDIPPIAFDDLIETARWMDSVMFDNWESRIGRIRYFVFDENDQLVLAEIFTFTEKIANVIGMVSSGKSSFMDVLAVHLAQRGFHVTIIVSDVMSALDKVQQFARLGIAVAPILGASTRSQHIGRLHSALSDEQPGMPWQQKHIGFRWLSTACPLDGLRRDVDKPLQMSEYPCNNLFAPSSDEPSACPLYSQCPYHQAQRDLANAMIWVGTPESLVYSQVPPQINEERLRFLELVSHRSDLVIFDEADKVQVRLDGIFSVAETLVGSGPTPWINRVSALALARMHELGHSPAANKRVQIWFNALLSAQKAITNLVHLLANNKSILKDKSKHFSDWTLFNDLGKELSGTDEESDPAYGELREIFTELIDNPFANNARTEVTELCTIARRLISDDEDEGQARKMIKGWITKHKTSRRATFGLDKTVIQFEFALLTTILQNRLNLLIRAWDQVEDTLGLKSSDVSSFNRPPLDYMPIIPASPTGNVLAFQYNYGSRNQAGDLRFIRYMGIGRWIMLHFHELFADIPGPNVLLLSGTSWAGTSPSYHIQLPVTGILRSPDEETEGIRKSEFEFMPVGNPAIKVSGSGPDVREERLTQMLQELAGFTSVLSLDGRSWLERERDLLPAGRQRILLIVGSYDEAEAVCEALVKIRREWFGQVIPLVRDEEELEEGELGIRRGRVHRFPQSEAWILVAPLMAIERGHNILNEQGQAAIGAALFLVRPHSRPDDLDYAIHSINRWALQKLMDGSWRRDSMTLNEAAEKFRQQAFGRWHGLLKLPLIYKSMPDYDRKAVTWSSIVTISQVIGRLVRGGSPAKVFFCDAAFMPRTAAYESERDDARSSLIIGMQCELQPYELDDTLLPRRDREAVKTLYGPFHKALKKVV